MTQPHIKQTIIAGDDHRRAHPDDTEAVYAMLTEAASHAPTPNLPSATLLIH